ncbi:hypothetical protein [Hymenobacter terricola]|uniref:hypothetical protein n=1 Tax=Hymenobacter terricola TaxID=2819236 RepID=UPI001B3127A8|nr:hypothetical protein [Hymenobacter terricola]
MFKSCIFTAVLVLLFWVALSASLLQAQLTVSPVYKMRVPTYRSMPMRSTVIAQVKGAATTASYN